MKRKGWKMFIPMMLISVLMMSALTGCKGSEDRKEAATEQTEAENDEKNNAQPAADDGKTEDTASETTDAGAEAGDSEGNEGDETDRLLEKHYEEKLIKQYGYIELPAGYEAYLTENQGTDGYVSGRAYFNEKGIVANKIWDFDKDGQDELLIYYLADDKSESTVKSKDASRLYADMYEVKDGTVVLADTMESFHYWMQYDVYQSAEVLLRETKDWFYICERAQGTSSIYQDGVSYVIRVAHYDGTGFEVDLAKQLSGSEFSDVDDEVKDTAHKLRCVTFDKTADNLTHEYRFDMGDDLVDIFYMTAEPNGSLDRYFQTNNISDVPPYIFRLYTDYESAD